MSDNDRAGAGDTYPDEQTVTGEPGLSGGEFPGAEEETEAMSGSLESAGADTTFGGALGDYGPTGTMGTIDEGNAVAAAPPDDDTQFDLGPERQ